MIDKCAAYLLRAIVTVLFWTLRIEIRGKEVFSELRGSALIAIWHSKLLLLAPLIRTVLPVVPISVLISKSRDGNIPSLYAETYNEVEVIRVGHKTRHGALLQTMQALESNRHVIITPDGPRGPAETIKPGVIFAAQKCQRPVITMSWHASRCIRLHSWDRFCIPLPFSKITVSFSTPFFFSESDTPESVERTLKNSFAP